MKNQFCQLIIIHFKEFFREPGALFWSFVFPILMSWGLGMAFTDKPETIRHIAIVQSSEINDTVLKKFINHKTLADKNITKQYSTTVNNEKLGKTTFNFVTTTWDSAVILMKRGYIVMILTEENSQIKYHFDPINPESQLVYITLSNVISDNDMAINTNYIEPMTIAGTRYIDFLIPGLLAMGIMSSCLWGISYGLIEKRSKKLLRRMVATPMNKATFMITLFLSRLVFTFLETVVLLLFSVFVFGVQIQGSLIAMAAVFFSGNLLFMGISILVASRTSNTQVGNGIISAINMPMMLLSGIFFSYSNFPDWAIPVIKYLPLTLFADSLRGIITEGTGIIAHLQAITIMCIVGVATFFAGLRIYKWY